MSETPESLSAPRLNLSWRKRIIFSAVLFLLIGLFVEVLLNVLCVVSPPVADALGTLELKIDDDILKHRPRPYYSDHDSRGFRNSGAIDRADIVCLGDSQTYGTGVSLADTWPHQLALSSGKSVYNMACGGWGPTHSEVLLEEAKQLRPKLIVEAFYAGNDLWDCYKMVYDRQRLTYHQSRDPEVKAAMQKANELDPLDPKIRALGRVYKGEFEDETEPRISVGRMLNQHSRIYGLYRAIRKSLKRDNEGRTASFDKQAWKELRSNADSSRGQWEVLDLPPFHTILVPEYRLTALNMNDPRIREGQRIALDAITNISLDLSNTDTQFLVVLIPTKQLVFAPQIQRPSDTYNELVKNEEEMWAKTKEYLTKNEIAFVDTLPAFRDLISKGIQPYKINTDGHPIAAGHMAISDVVLQWIRDNASNK